MREIREEEGFVEVFATAEIDVLPVIESVLRSADIPFIVQGGNALGQLPTGLFAGPFTRKGLAARVLVPEALAEDARELLSTEAEVTQEVEELSNHEASSDENAVEETD